METNTIPAHFIIKASPAANPKAVVTTGKAHFTVLTPRMIRMEWGPAGKFEERASQAFWYRNQPVPEFRVQKTNTRVVIETAALKLVYVPDTLFSGESLWIELKETGKTWHYGDEDPG
ncbi:MAG: DUF4968 domain-containing protein, partial [Anaerolineaceae bacterium]|nr:DUF4968 domain-containing protein [Anaerolineaceae bacterium]